MRRRVKTTYQRAGSSPSSRHRRSQGPTAGISEGGASKLSPLARYIAENEDSGISIPELIEQFQELDCEHGSQTVLAVTSEKRVVKCDDCGKVTTLWKPGMQ